MSRCVLDASAILAILNHEPGAENVVGLLADDRGVASTVNLAEVVSKLQEGGTPPLEIRRSIGRLRLEIIGFDERVSYRTGLLRAPTRQAGLSLADRACLGLAQSLGLPAVTMDRAWGRVQLGIDIQVAR